MTSRWPSVTGSNDPGTTAIRCIRTSVVRGRHAREGRCGRVSALAQEPARLVVEAAAHRRRERRVRARARGRSASSRCGELAGVGDDVAVARDPQQLAATSARRTGSPPSTSPSWRSSRSTWASSKPSRVAATASTRCRASEPGSAAVTSRQSPGTLAAADPAAQLVQLRDAEPVGVDDDHRARVRHVDADLDDRRRDEHVDLAGGERAHRRVLLVGASCGRAAGRSARRRSAGARASSASTDGDGCRGRRRHPRRRRRRRAPRRRPRRPWRSIAGQTTNACRPSASSSASRSQTRGRQPGLLGERHDVRLDAGAAGGQLADGRHVEVAEHGHRDGARDRAWR